MKLGLVLPQGSGSDMATDVTAVARRAEEIGYAGLWAYERVLFPLEPTDGMYGVPGLPWAPFYESCADPLTVLSLAAAVTTRARLGTCLLIAPLHNALHLARALATLDLATRGRVVAGFGTGWSTDEYRAAGADFARRGRSTDELVDALRALWGPNPVTYADSRMSVHNALTNPKPHGRIPILFGGSGPAAMRRIARAGDGWVPVRLTGAPLAEGWRTLRELAGKTGRDPQSLQLVPLGVVNPTPTAGGADRGAFTGSREQIVEDIAAAAEAGAHELILSLEAASRDTEELIDRAADLFAAAKAAGVLDG